MADEKTLPGGIRIADKAALRKILEEYNRETGSVPDPNVTAQEVREMMIAAGMRPEDNSGSREIIRMRYGDEECSPQRHPEGGKQMALTEKRSPGIVPSDRKALIKILDEYDRRTGFVPDPTATVEKLRAMMLADGVRPDENSASREIIRIREGLEE